MPDKTTILQKADSELEQLFENTPVEARDNDFFGELEIKTAFRNNLSKAELPDRILELLEQKDGLLHGLMDYWAGLDFEKMDIDRGDIDEVIELYTDHVDYEDKDQRLYDRMNRELNDFLDELRGKTPQEIIDAAFAIVIRQDILLLFDDHDFEKRQLDVLLTLEKPLSCLYEAWFDSDASYMEQLREVVEGVMDEQETHLTLHNYDRKVSPPLVQEFYSLYEREEKDVGLEP